MWGHCTPTLEHVRNPAGYRHSNLHGTVLHVGALNRPRRVRCQSSCCQCRQCTRSNELPGSCCAKQPGRPRRRRRRAAAAHRRRAVRGRQQRRHHARAGPGGAVAALLARATQPPPARPAVGARDHPADVVLTGERAAAARRRCTGTRAPCSSVHARHCVWASPSGPHRLYVDVSNVQDLHSAALLLRRGQWGGWALVTHGVHAGCARRG